MANKPIKATVKTLELDAPGTGSILVATAFDHRDAHYSEGVHNDLDAGLVREIVEAGKAEACERPAARSDTSEGAPAATSDA